MKGVVALLNDEQRTKFAEQIAEVRKPPGKLPEQKRLLNRGAPRKQFPISDTDDPPARHDHRR